MQKLCSGDWDRTLQFSVFDWNRLTNLFHCSRLLYKSVQLLHACPQLHVVHDLFFVSMPRAHKCFWHLYKLLCINCVLHIHIVFNLYQYSGSTSMGAISISKQGLQLTIRSFNILFDANHSRYKTFAVARSCINCYKTFVVVLCMIHLINKLYEAENLHNS